MAEVVSNPFLVVVKARPGGGAQDFATRRSQPGVVRWVGFDSAADMGGKWKAAFPGPAIGHTPETGGSPHWDGAKSASADGGGSLRFDVPAGGSGNRGSVAGDWWMNFSDNHSVYFDEGDTFYVQWRQWFSPEAVAAGGFKHAHIIAGDHSSIGNTSSCDLNELVLQNSTYANYVGKPENVTTLYHRCPADGGVLPNMVPVQTSWRGSVAQLQPARPPYCLWYTSGPYTSRFPPVGTCFGLFANEWMTYKICLTLGAWTQVQSVGQGGAKTNQWGWRDSRVRLWMARGGQPSELTNDWTVSLRGGYSSDKRRRYGKLWLDVWGGAAHPDGYSIWYDEIIVSRDDVADPL